MSRTGVSLCLLLFAATPAAASRIQAQVKSKDQVGTSSGGGPNKCTITWNPREGQTASVTFGVSSCRTQCTATSFDNNHNKMFPSTFVQTETIEAFGPGGSSRGSRCVCTGSTGLQVSFVGKCSDPAVDPAVDKKKCWDVYKVLSTDRYEKAIGHKGAEKVVVKHNPPMTRSDTFHYNNPVCEQDGLLDDPDSLEGFLPGLSTGRTQEEKEIFVQAIIKHEQGEDIAKDVQDIVSALTVEEIQLLKQGECALFKEYLTKEVAEADAENRVLTVRDLSVAYEAKLEHGTGLSVEHLISVAGYDAVEGLDAVLSCARFATFLKPGTWEPLVKGAKPGSFWSKIPKALDTFVQGYQEE